MNDLIEALNIFAKYITDGDNAHFPTSCEHDTLYVDVDPMIVTPADSLRLEELGFIADADLQNFHSYRFGSC